MVDRGHCRNYKAIHSGSCCLAGGISSRRNAAFPIVLQYLDCPVFTDLTLQIIFNWWVAGHMCAATVLTFGSGSKPNRVQCRCILCIRTEVGHRTTPFVCVFVRAVIFSDKMILCKIWSPRSGCYKENIFWNIAQCDPLKVVRPFRETWRLHFHDKRISKARNQLSMLPASWFLIPHLVLDPEDGGGILLRYINWLPTEYMTSHPRR
jgi:hypothetical protein